MNRLAPLFLLLFALLATLLPPDGLRGLTGEEQLAAQLRGLGHLLSGRLRPYPATAPLEPVRHAGLYPFGLNTFLQNETEPDKVERSLDMIAVGGFRWIRQEFPWEDLEIHRDGWFVDLRNNEVRDAWAKYDRIVALAEARDIAIIARLSTPPAWSRTEGDANGAKAPPDDLEDYGDYVEAVVTRYRGRIRYYQIWNEPNCCEEWGRRSVSPEAYAALLRVAHSRARAADPDAVILTAPLAPTIELVESSVTGAPPALNDFLFLQRLYDAGAQPYFDVLSVQDYGLWSGPTDRRMRPRVINYSRPEYIRDLMVRNGDAHKAIWASEIGWNATPPGSGIPQNFGYTPEAQRGPYLVAALERQQREWPWLGVTTIWFFKPASDEEANQPQYYFRLVEPDFTPLPAWESLTAYLTTLEPTLYRGYHQEDHWVLREETTGWALVAEEEAIFEQAIQGVSGDALIFHVEGERLTVVLNPASRGALSVQVGDSPPRRFIMTPDGAHDEQSRPIGSKVADADKDVLRLPLGDLPPGRAPVRLIVEAGTILLDGVIVE